MKKFFVNIICAFIPNDEYRRDVRRRLLGRAHAPQAPAGAENKAFVENLTQIKQQLTAIHNTLILLPAIINRNTEKKLSTAMMHQKTFLPFKAIHSGQDIVIVATGPSLKDFKPIKNAVYIGVNNAFLYPGVKLDYLFAQDYLAVSDNIKEMNKYRRGKCKKFYGLTTEFHAADGFRRVIPERDAIAADAYRYRTDWEDLAGFENRLAFDISTQPLGCFGSIVFPAVQFALWTNPKRIYLVGCDCSNLGHFDDTQSEDLTRLIEPWRKLKEFQSVYYPNTEIISVNPVGLAGMFADMYQNKEL